MEKEITRKSIFLTNWKSKIGYSLNYKDIKELETIIDYYETQLKKQKEIIDKLRKYIEKWSRYYGLSMSTELGIHFDNILSILEDKEV